MFQIISNASDIFLLKERSALISIAGNSKTCLHIVYFALYVLYSSAKETKSTTSVSDIYCCIVFKHEFVITEEFSF